ncbi:peptidoglycan L-alanyl-D-glutamate endopeptidase CwlK [Hydrobacter penzbergensis]|uniref:Peptidoglycan L-alanyl-D-glutamate endopeptidase CwlK n=1 Tax=Hydrobacter penzbergensis TaxID=1235997 RepID=A0A8X8IDW2_9BACT|nr:M15 family metallopeptidase [Hydrobacter penzbergensis]SDW45793.1 peptidoglycan L-alanyl-D-glutamate endopeptidase CwlK [Hydrobacter penzbergensis]
MSYNAMKSDILFYQRFLQSNNLYMGKLDGIWGPLSDKADKTFRQMSSSIADEMGKFDERSEQNITTLLLPVQRIARRFLASVGNYDSIVKIISGTRTYQEQDKLYAQGRTIPNLPIVTNAKGGQSNHNFGLAWDIGLFEESGLYIEDDTKYQEIAELTLPHLSEIEWGGEWRRFKDYPHYQYRTSTDEIAAIRQRFEAGSVLA